MPSFSDLESHLPRLTPERLAQVPDSHLLFFRTSSVHFTTRFTQEMEWPEISHVYYATQFPVILDPRDGDRVVGRLPRIVAERGSTDLYMAEYIMVGLRGDPNIPLEIMPAMALVLQVDRDEDGIVQRRNYGEIELFALDAAKSEDCLVVFA